VNRLGRYFRLLSAFARFCLANEMAFRGNFLMKVLVEVLWLGILLIFYQTLFRYTSKVGDWDANQYLFFLGCYYTLEGLIETLFLENAMEFADNVRTGSLDFYLLKPIDEQFLVSLRKIDWSTATKIPLGAAIMGFALAGMGWTFNPLDLPAALAGRGWVFDPGKVAGFVLLFACGAALAYSFLLILSSLSVWLVRNENLMEWWWLFTTLMRYPRENYMKGWSYPIYIVCWYVVPVLLVTNVPAQAMVRVLEPWNVALLIAATAVMLSVSRRFFFRALRSYSSASS
jgi:viologen exporter family transport system permease protein